MYPFKTILVTGAAGFIGSNFVRLMLSRYPDIRIVSYDALTYAGNLKNLENLKNSEHHVFIKGDIRDEVAIHKILREYQIDTIVHFAAESHVDNSIQGPKIFFETNVLGTFNLVEQAKKYWLDELKLDKNQSRFHHVSTDEVYGMLRKEDPAFTELNKYEPSSPYSASKAGSDHIVYAYYCTYGLPITISNCSNNYGPYQHPEKYIPVIINSCRQGKKIPVYGNGSNIRDWLYVEDHCDAIDCILRTGTMGETYNVGGNNEIDNLSLAKKLCAIMDEFHPESAPHEKLISFVEDRKGHDWRYAIDNSKIVSELGWQPRQDVGAMLRKTVEFYLKKNPTH